MKNPTVDLHSPEADAIRQAAETLRGKSKQELMETLRQTMGEQRAAGTLDNEQLDDVFPESVLNTSPTVSLPSLLPAPSPLDFSELGASA